MPFMGTDAAAPVPSGMPPRRGAPPTPRRPRTRPPLPLRPGPLRPPSPRQQRACVAGRHSLPATLKATGFTLALPGLPVEVLLHLTRRRLSAAASAIVLA